MCRNLKLFKKTIINNGELPKYHAEDTHEAIIDVVTFQAVQKEKARLNVKSAVLLTPINLMCGGVFFLYR